MTSDHDVRIGAGVTVTQDVPSGATVVAMPPNIIGKREKDTPGVEQGNTAVLIGHDGREEISVYELAERCGTITNEILSRFGARTERVMVDGIYSKMQNYLHKEGDAESFRTRRSPQGILTDFQGLQRSAGRFCAPNCAKNFFEAFRFARTLIKEALPSAEVGGPMGIVSSDEDFMQDFLLNCRKENCLPDFVSFLLFPYYTTWEGDHWQNELAASETVELDYTAAMTDLLQRTGCSDCKLYVTEWNNTVSSRNYLNDSAFRGTYFVRKLPELAERVDLICPWLDTDLISSYHDVKGLANGSPGLLTRDSIPKPALYALQFLNALGTNLVERSPGYIVTSKESGSFYILCTNFKWYGCNYFLKRELLDEPTEAEHIFEDEDLMELSLTLENLPRDCFYLVKERSISPQEGAVLGEWKKFQYEEHLSASNLSYLREVCAPKRNLSRKKAVGGGLQLELVLHPHEVRLIHIQRETERPR